MPLPLITGADLYSAFVAKINAAINKTVETLTRTGKTLTLERNDGSTLDFVELAAAPNEIINGVTLSQDVTDQRIFTAAAGLVIIDDLEVVVAGNSIATGNGDATHPRIDALYVNNLGALKLATGTASATPAPPVLAASQLLVGFVYVEPNATDTLENIYLKPTAPTAPGVYTKYTGQSFILGGDGFVVDAATQAEVNNGIEAAKFISPLTFADSTTKTATQTEVNNGIEENLYVTPETLSNYTGFPTVSASYVEKWDTITPTTNNAWHSVPAGVGNNKVILITIDNTSGTDRMAGARSVGGLSDRRFDMSKHSSFTTTAKTDGAGNIELYAELIGASIFKIIGIL